LLEKTKDKEKEKMLLDTRQPFMNRVGFSPPDPTRYVLKLVHGVKVLVIGSQLEKF